MTRVNLRRLTRSTYNFINTCLAGDKSAENRQKRPGKPPTNPFFPALRRALVLNPSYLAPHLLLGLGTWPFSVGSPTPSLFTSSLSIPHRRAYGHEFRHVLFNGLNQCLLPGVPSAQTTSLSIPHLSTDPLARDAPHRTTSPRPHSPSVCFHQGPVWRAEPTRGIASDEN